MTKCAPAEEILRRVEAGEDFAELAVTYSDGRNALEGGILGWKKASELPNAFASALQGAKEEDVTDLIRSGAGFHIIKVIGTRSEDRVPIEQTRAQHVLVRPGELATEEEAIRRLEELRERVVNGEEFAGIARAHSTTEVLRCAGATSAGSIRATPCRSLNAK